MLTNYRKFNNRNVQTFGFVYHDTNGPNHGTVSKTQSFLLKGICTVTFWQDFCGKGNLRKSFLSSVGRRFPIGNVFSYIVKKGLFLSVYLDDIKLCGKKQNIDLMWNVLNKEVDLGTNIFPGSCILGCTQRQCQVSIDIMDNYRTMFESRISVRGTEKLPYSENLRIFHGLMTWRVMQRSVWNDIVSWQTRRLDNSTKCLLRASMTTTSKKKN